MPYLKYIIFIQLRSLIKNHFQKILILHFFYFEIPTIKALGTYAVETSPTLVIETITLC